MEKEEEKQNKTKKEKKRKDNYSCDLKQPQLMFG